MLLSRVSFNLIVGRNNAPDPNQLGKRTKCNLMQCIYKLTLISELGNNAHDVILSHSLNE